MLVSRGCSDCADANPRVPSSKIGYVVAIVSRVAGLTMKAKASPDFTGYWQRHIQD